jgi:hypothetical protein
MNYCRVRDQAVRAVAATGGVICVNFIGGFLNPQGLARPYDIAKHVEYIGQMVGRDKLCVGPDYVYNKVRWSITRDSVELSEYAQLCSHHKPDGNVDMKTATTRTLLAVSILAFSMAATAQDPGVTQVPSEVTLFKNVMVFNGIDEELQDVDVLVVRNKISAIAEDIPTTGTYELDAETGFYLRENRLGEQEKVQVPVNLIDGGGRTLMPGIIGGHEHVGLPVAPGDVAGPDYDWQYLAAASSAGAKFYLDHGWTTLREAGGPSEGLRRAIDEGLIPGPRIYTAMQYISQTSGHGDMRSGYAAPHPNELPVAPWH